MPAIEKGTMHLMLANLILMITGYLTYIGLGRLFTPAQLGVYGVVMAIIAILNELLVTGMQQAVSKFISERPQLGALIKLKGLKLQFFIGLIFSLALVLLSDCLALLLNDISLSFFIKLSAMILLFRAISSVFLGYLNGLKEFKAQAWLNIIFSFSKLILILGLVWLGLAVFGAILGFIIASVLLVFFGLFFTQSGKKISRERFETKKLFYFSTPLLLFTLITSVLINLDLFFIKALSPAAISSTLAGYYSIAIYLGRIPELLVIALAAVLFPLISSTTFTQNLKKTQFYIHRSLRYTLLFLVPFTAIIASSAPQLILFFSSKYLEASTATAILCIGSTFYALFLMLSTVITGSGKPKISLALAVIMLVVSFVANIVLVPLYSLEGAALASSLAMFAGFLLAGAWVLKKFRTLTSIKSITRILAAGIVTLVISIFFPLTGLLLVLKIILLFGIYALILFVSRELTKTDFQVIKDMIW